jgi:hypothetical protein
MFGRRFMFRTRAPERDSQSDKIRRDAVAGVVSRIRAEVEREIEGLEARMQDAYIRATALLDDSAEFGRRPEQEESDIVAFEQTADADLKRELALFSEISGLIDRA